MALRYPAMGSHGILFRTQSGVLDVADSAISVADPRCQRKNKKEKKKYSAPPVQTTKKAKEIASVLPFSNSDVMPEAELGCNPPPPESSVEKEEEEEKINGGRRLIVGLAREEARPRSTASLPWKESRGFVMDDRRRRLVEMAKRYLRKHRRSDPSEDACYSDGGGDESPTKRQRLGN